MARPVQADDNKAMTRIIFTIRYHSQLKRTRPDLIGDLEAAVSGSLRGSGAVTAVSAGRIEGRFATGALASWLDALTALRSIAAALAAAEAELFGRAVLVIGGDGEDSAAQLRRLSVAESATGIWCDAAAAAALAPYARLEPAADAPPWSRLLEFTLGTSVSGDYWLRPALIAELGARLPRRWNEAPGVLALVGPDHYGKRPALRSALSGGVPDWPVYTVRFGVGGVGLACLLDGLTEGLLKRLAGSDIWRSAAAVWPRLERTAGADRLRAPAAPALRQEAASLLAAFASAWNGLSRAAGRPALYALENYHLADAETARLAVDVFAPAAAAGATVLLTADEPTALRPWRDSAVCLLRVEAPGRDEVAAWLKSVRGPAGDRPVAPEYLSRLTAIAGRDGLAAAFRSAIGWKADPDPAMAHPRLSRDLLEFAAAAFFLRRFFPAGALVGEFLAEGKPRASIDFAFAALADCGLIAGPEDPETTLPEFREFAERGLGEATAAVTAMVRRRLLSAVADRRLRPSFGFLEAYGAVEGDCGDDIILDAIENEAADGNWDLLARAAASRGFEGIVGAERAPSLRALVRGRAVLAGPAGAPVAVAPLRPAPPEAGAAYPAPRYRAALLLDQAAGALGSGDVAGAAGPIKQAMLLLQDKPGSRGLARAYRLLAQVELGGAKIGEAIDYFGFAAETAAAAGDAREAVLADAGAALAQFCFGDLSRAERLAKSAAEAAAGAYAADWEPWCRFFAARLRFEAGAYREAAGAFDALGASFGPAAPEVAAAAAAWSFRCSAYGQFGDWRSVRNVAADDEYALFGVEARYFAGDFAAAQADAEALLARRRPALFLSPEIPDWSGVFDAMENRVFGGRGDGRDAARNQARAIRALCLAERGQAEAALAEIRNVVKDESASEYDPADAAFHHTYSRLLAVAGASAVDVGTALGIAFKRLQRRASRIDDAGVKRGFLTAQRWHAALYADAKAHYLI
jgi:hypothetical protein